jgi:hypothetical protein
MNPTFYSEFTITNYLDLNYEGKSEHCQLVTYSEIEGIFPSLKNGHQYIEVNGEEFKVVGYFCFSFDHVDNTSKGWGELIRTLSNEFNCLIMCDNGWWDVYVPIQYLKHMNNFQLL